MAFNEQYSGIPSSATLVPQCMRPSDEPAISPLIEIFHHSVSSQTGNITLGNGGQRSTVQVTCNSGSGLMDQTTPYLNFDLVVATAPAGLYFKGNALANGTVAQARGSIYSMLRRMTVTFAGQRFEQNYVDKVMNHLLCHSSNRSWLDNDGNTLLGVSRDFGADATYKCVIPISPLLFFNQERMIPLNLTSQPMIFQFDWNSGAESFFTTDVAGCANTTYDIQNVCLNYTALYPDPGYMSEVQSAFASGSLYSLPYKHYEVIALASQASMIYDQPIQTSSLRSVTVLSQTTASQLSTAQNINACDIPYGITNFNVYTDNKLRNMYPLSSDNPVITFLELNKAYAKINDSTRVDCCTLGHFIASGYATTLNLTRAIQNEGNHKLLGTPCGSCKVSFQTTGGANTIFIIYAIERILIINSMGQVSFSP
jgi:hypothetical protein